MREWEKRNVRGYVMVFVVLGLTLIILLVRKKRLETVKSGKEANVLLLQR